MLRRRQDGASFAQAVAASVLGSKKPCCRWIAVHSHLQLWPGRPPPWAAAGMRAPSPGSPLGSWRRRRAPLPSLADEPEPEDVGGHAAPAAHDAPDASPSEHRGAAAAAAAGSEPRR